MPDSSIIWRGNRVTMAALRRIARLAVTPGIGWLLVFFVLPTLLLLGIAFATRSPVGGIEWKFTTANFTKLVGYGTFGWKPTNLTILLRSLNLAALTTVICLLLAYPLAFFIAMRPARTRTLWLIALTVPFWTNLIVRTYAWLILLGPESPIARLAAWLDWVPAGAPLYPGMFATGLGMVSAFLPFMVMPLYASVEKMQWSLVEAAQDLYGGAWRVFRHAILPQTMPGLSVGVLLTFIPSMGSFVVSDILGGAKFMLVGNLIQMQFSFGSGSPPYAAALVLVLILITLGLIALFSRLGGKKEELI